MNNPDIQPVPTKTRRRTREALLEAACKLFSTVGFEGTTISALEAEAGLKPGRGSFYRHFGSKEKLFDEVIANETEKLLEFGEQRLGILGRPLGDTRADLLLKFRFTMIGLDKFRSFIDILIREENRFLAEEMEDFRRRFVEEPLERNAIELKGLMDLGDVVQTNHTGLAAVITSALLGNFLVKRYYQMDSMGGVDDDEFSSLLVDLVTGSSRVKNIEK